MTWHGTLSSCKWLCRQATDISSPACCSPVLRTPTTMHLLVSCACSCMSRGSSLFSSSFVISEKLLSKEKELKSLHAQLRAITTSRDDLAEDIQQLRFAKRQSDTGWQADRERCAALDREVAFYQNSSAKAMSDRDRAQFEADELRQQASNAFSHQQSAL